MESHDEQTHFVKRVVLPSGKTIEVVYFNEADDTAAKAEPVSPQVEPDQELHTCLECHSQLVYPVEWEEAGNDAWAVLLHCPDCGVLRDGVFSQETVERFDEELDRGAEHVARDYRRLMRANMAEEIDRFASALQAGAVLPEDF